MSDLLNIKKRKIYSRRRDGQLVQGGNSTPAIAVTSNDGGGGFDPVILQDYAKKVDVPVPSQKYLLDNISVDAGYLKYEVTGISVENADKLGGVLAASYARRDAANAYEYDQTINADLYVNGNIIQNGSAYETHAEHLKVENNLMQLNVGEPGNQITGVIPGTSIPFSGLEVNRGPSADKYYLGVVEGAKPLLKLGKKDSLEAIATREDNPTNDYPMVWDDANKYLKSVGAVRDSLKLGGELPNAYWKKNELVEANGYLKYSNVKIKSGDSDNLGGRIASDYWHKDNSNLSTVDWTAQYLNAKSLNLGDRFSGDLNSLPDDIPLNTFSTRLFDTGAINRPSNVAVSDGIIHTYNWNGSKYALQIAHDIDGTGSAFRHRSGSGTSWGVWSKYYTSLNANRSDVDWQGRDLTAHRILFALGDSDLQGNVDVHGYVGSPDYASGFTGADWRILKSGWAELDYLELRKGLTVPELVVARERSVNGGIITSVANGTVKSVNGDVVTLKGKYNSFIVGDRVRLQEWEDSTRYMEAEVTAVSGMTITLGNYLNTTRPLANEDLVQWGHVSETSRQNFLYQTARGADAGYFAVLHGVNSSSLTDKQVLRIGNLKGYANDGFGIASKFGGKTYFELSNTNKTIAGWEFTDTTFAKGWVDAAGIMISSNIRSILVRHDGTYGYFGQTWDIATAKYTGHYGISFGNESTKKEYFRIDSQVRRIAGMTFDEEKFTAGNVQIWKTGDIINTAPGTPYAWYGNGNFSLGKGQIGYNAATNVITFAPSVKMTWGQITGTENIETIQGAQAKVEAIEIGGRNLITNGAITTYDNWNFTSSKNIMTNAYASPFTSAINIWTSCKMSQNITLRPGTYTISCWVRSYHGDTDSFTLEIGNNSKQFAVTGGTYKKFSYSVTTTAESTSITISCVGDADIMVAQVQVERGNKATDWTPSQVDVNANVTTITNNTISTTNLLAQNLQVNFVNVKGKLLASHIESLSITGDKIAAGTITTTKLAANTITAEKIATGAITADKLSANAVTADRINGLELTFDKGNIGGFSIASTTLKSLNGSNNGVILSAGSSPSISISNSPDSEAFAYQVAVNGVMKGYLTGVSYSGTDANVGVLLKSTDDDLILESSKDVRINANEDLRINVGSIRAVKIAKISSGKTKIELGDSFNHTQVVVKGLFSENGQTVSGWSTNSGSPTLLDVNSLVNVYYADNSTGNKMYVSLPLTSTVVPGTTVRIGTAGRDIGFVAKTGRRLRWDNDTKRTSGTLTINEQNYWIEWTMIGDCWNRSAAGNY
jgi:hypothetical protein